MNKNILEKFRGLVASIKDAYRGKRIVTIDIKPELRELCVLIDENPDTRSEFVREFLLLVDELKPSDDKPIRSNEPILYIINTCMNRAKWEEVGSYLKQTYPFIDDLDTMLAIEMTIKLLYDRNWNVGKTKLRDDYDHNVWNVFEKRMSPRANQ